MLSGWRHGPALGLDGAERGLSLRAGSTRPSWLPGATRCRRLGQFLLRTARRCRSGWLIPVRQVELGEVDGSSSPAMRAHCRSRPGPGGSCTRHRMKEFGRSARRRGLRRVSLGFSELCECYGKFGELRDEHHRRGLVLVANSCRERKHPGGGPQLVPDWCAPGDAAVAAASRPGVAVGRLPERPGCPRRRRRHAGRRRPPRPRRQPLMDR